FLRCWMRLPTELHDYIYDFLTSPGRKADFLTLSLVSQTWCRYFRPRLFARLILKSEKDCRMLCGMVRSPLSSWLAEHIIELRFHYIIPPGYPLRTALVRFLPACRHIRHDFHDKPARVLLSHNAALKSSLRSITSLTLINCDFSSFRIVLHVLGDITYLEKVAFWKIKWLDDRLTTADTVSDVCAGAFSHVRSVEMDFCTNNVAVPAWILAAASTQHSFTRSAVPAQMWTTIKLFQKFLGDSTYNSRFDVKEATAGELDRSLYQAVVLIG
ncbi:uncharacterized protein PHACADRAFT_84292, partial [Phanerochaete carnosa HHB-10118-sp]